MAFRQLGFTEIIFADDLNGFKTFANNIANDIILEELETCQNNLHSWGGANRVLFDASKESFHILSRSSPFGENFTLLGIEFDNKLLMDDVIYNTITSAFWKLKSLLRTKKFYTIREIITMFKMHILTFIEYRTPGIGHAASSSLIPLDKIQSRFLEEIGVNAIDALIHFNLAPLSTRRDLAMLGVIHRSILQLGCNHFQFFLSSIRIRRVISYASIPNNSLMHLAICIEIIFLDRF